MNAKLNHGAAAVAIQMRNAQGGQPANLDELSLQLRTQISELDALIKKKEKALENVPDDLATDLANRAKQIEGIASDIEQIKNEPTWKTNDRNSVTVFKSETMRIVLMGLHENAELKSHKANGVISIQTLEGKINFVTEMQSVILEKGQMIALEENIIHSVMALKVSFFLLTLSMNKK